MLMYRRCCVCRTKNEATTLTKTKKYKAVERICPFAKFDQCTRCNAQYFLFANSDFNFFRRKQHVFGVSIVCIVLLINLILFCDWYLSISIVEVAAKTTWKKFYSLLMWVCLSVSGFRSTYSVYKFIQLLCLTGFYLSYHRVFSTRQAVNFAPRITTMALAKMLLKAK